MTSPNEQAEARHIHIVRLDESRHRYTHCDDCGGLLPFAFNLDWAVEQLVRTAREHDVHLDFTFTAIESRQS